MLRGLVFSNYNFTLCSIFAINLIWIVSWIGYLSYSSSLFCIMIVNIVYLSNNHCLDHKTSTYNNSECELPSIESVNYQIQMLNWRILINKILTIQVLKVEFNQSSSSLEKIRHFVDNGKWTFTKTEKKCGTLRRCKSI